jgi:peptide/nickel transport system substrate-binding protein
MAQFRKAVLIAAATAVLALTACSGGGGSPSPSTDASGNGITIGAHGGQQLALGDPVSGGQLDWGMLGYVQSLDPAGPLGDSIQLTASAIYGTLMEALPDGTVQPSLAESLTTTDNVVWTLALTPDLTFTDGEPLNAEAVIAHIENVAADGSTSVAAGDARSVKKMTAIDEWTVEFTLVAPNNQFDLNFTDNSMGMIPSKVAKESAGDDFGLAPVGAGPFKVEAFRPGIDVDLVENPDYKFADRGLPYLDRVHMVTVQEQQTRISGVVAGDLDAATAGSVPDLEDARAQGLTGLEQQSYSAYYLVLNVTDPVLSDLRVRQAISYALDRDAINKAVYEGTHRPMTGMLVPGHPYADDDPGVPQYDLSAAQDLMEEYRSEAGADDIEIEVMITPGSEAAQTAQLVQQMLGQIGVSVTIAPTEPTVQVGKYASGTNQASLVPRSIRAETTTALRHYFQTGTNRNWSKFSSPTYDALIDETISATSDGERLGYVKELLAVVSEELPMIPVIAGGSGRILGPAVSGFPDGDATSATAERFDLSRVWVVSE